LKIYIIDNTLNKKIISGSSSLVERIVAND
jgi:hypothetical protein